MINNISIVTVIHSIKIITIMLLRSYFFINFIIENNVNTNTTIIIHYYHYI